MCSILHYLGPIQIILKNWPSSFSRSLVVKCNPLRATDNNLGTVTERFNDLLNLLYISFNFCSPFFICTSHNVLFSLFMCVCVFYHYVLCSFGMFLFVCQDVYVCLFKFVSGDICVSLLYCNLAQHL